jgi:DNA-binding GntR family transcriptional regulator
MSGSSKPIEEVIVDAVLAGQVRARSRLGEQALATLFDVLGLLGDFHVCMVEAFGNQNLADILRDLIARTVLISALYQSTGEASESCDEHEQITYALEAGNLDRGADLMARDIGNVQAGLTKRIDRDPLLDLRRALQLAVRQV